MDFIIGPGINTGAVSKSLNEWNKRFPSNKKIFGNYTASPPGVNYDNDNLGNGQNEIFLTSNVNFNVDGREVAAYANAIKNNLGEIVESDISLNPKFTWGDKKTSNVDHDFEGVMTHELGHSLGLGDLYGAYGTRDRTECSGTTMYGGVPEVEWRTLEKGDIKGLIDLYRLPSSTTILPSQTFTLASSVFETVAIPSSSYFLSSLLNLFSLSAVPQVSTQAAKTDEIQQCDYNGKTYKGLDEFRTQKTDISSTIEIKPKPTKDGKEIAIINNGDCPICDTNNASCQNSRKVCLKNSESKNGTWGNLKLIEQLTYLKEKIDQIKSSTEKDISQLDSARTKIAAC
ncbi:MAG: hypothetical protein Q7K54_05140, partial [Candidatus Parcubacteria bacterium]|nr:hypothetical protein [Candidatus Parcubacteria bacterium]